MKSIDGLHLTVYIVYFLFNASSIFYGWVMVELKLVVELEVVGQVGGFLVTMRTLLLDQSSAMVDLGHMQLQVVVTVGCIGTKLTLGVSNSTVDFFDVDSHYVCICESLWTLRARYHCSFHTLLTTQSPI